MNTSHPSAPALAPAPSSASAYPFLPSTRVSGRTLLWSVLTGMALVVPLLGLIQFLPLPAASEASVAARAARLAHPPAAWLLALKSLVLYPLVEECVYRGIILQLLRRYLPLWIALMPPTLLFGLTHWGSSPQNAVFALLVGFYFAWLAVGSRSLVPSMLCHSAINLLMVFGLPHVPGMAADGNFSQPVVWVLLALSLIALAVGVRQLRGEFKRSGPVAA